MFAWLTDEYDDTGYRLVLAVTDEDPSKEIGGGTVIDIGKNKAGVGPGWGYTKGQWSEPVVAQESLDPAGALATLLVVQGVLPIQDAADAVNVTPADLQNEASAWAVAPSE